MFKKEAKKENLIETNEMSTKLVQSFQSSKNPNRVEEYVNNFYTNDPHYSPFSYTSYERYNSQFYRKLFKKDFKYDRIQKRFSRESLFNIIDFLTEKHKDSGYYYVLDHNSCIFLNNDGIPMSVFKNEKLKDLYVNYLTYDKNNDYLLHNKPSCVIILKEGLIMNLDSEGISFYHDFDVNEFIDFFEELKPFFVEVETIRECSIIVDNGGSLSLKSFEARNYEMDINLMYEDSFKETDETIKNFIKKDGTSNNGLIILHGTPGTGKTSYIRHIIGMSEKPIVYCPTELVMNLSSPNMLSFLMGCKGSIFIVEDCEELLAKRGSNLYLNNGIASILNATDGILGDAIDISFICTFNAQLKDIDEALLRQGRLKAKYEFHKLQPTKVEKIAEKFNIVIPDDKKTCDMSLAEIFNLGKTNYVPEKTPVRYFHM